MQVGVEVDTSTCVGSMTCVALAPDHFEMIDGTSSARSSPTQPDDTLLDAADSCPVAAITIRETP